MKASQIRKALAITLSMTLGAAALTGCGSSSTTSSSTASASTSETATSEAATSTAASGDFDPFTIYGVTDPQEAAQLIIAEKMGYYKEQGLDVTNQLIESSGDLPSYVAGGEAKVVAESIYTSVELAAQGMDCETITSNSNSAGTQCVVAGKGVTINSPKDLEGKKLGIMSGAGVYMALEKMCKENDVDISTIEVSYLSPSEQVAALANGTIDLMACWEPYVSQAVDQGGTLLFTGSHCYIPGMEGDVNYMDFYSTITVTRDFYTDHRAECVALVKAFAEATDYINNNLDDAAKIIADYLNNDEATIKNIMSKNVYENVCNQSFVDATQAMAEYMLSNKLIDKIPDVDTYITPDILKEVNPDGATYVPGTGATTDEASSRASSAA
ncbi:MAG: ABC transporter substrate-binding protein [Lachnospiraceae bacterium]|nr:ABC transporter substrate-binding protein [Lachnospiraceae bacterium]